MIVIMRCQEHQHPEQQRKAIGIDLEQQWVQLADSKGEINEYSDSAVVESAEFSPDEKYIATGSALGKELIVWDVETHEILYQKRFKEKLEIVCFSPDNEYLLAGGEFNFLYILKTGNWKQHMAIDLPSGIEGMSLSNNGEILALGREDGVIMLLNTEDFTEIDSLIHGFHGKSPEYNNPDYRADVNSLDFTPDDEYLVSGGLDGDIKIWFLPERKLIKTIQAHQSSIKSVRINIKGNCIASASSGLPHSGDNSIKIWDFKSGDLLHKLSSPYGMEAVEFNPSGEFLLGGALEVINKTNKPSPKGQIYIYYIPDDFLTEPIRLVHKEPVYLSEYFDFNASGTRLVSGHEDGSVRLWKVKYK
ncbi:MAG: WD40 repeat domain-containing protein [Bacteroidota bacterium]